MCTQYCLTPVLLAAGVMLFVPAALVAQTGSIHEPVRYAGGPAVHNPAHDGQLRPAIGIETVQVMRANRTHPEWADDDRFRTNADRVAHVVPRASGIVRDVRADLGDQVKAGEILAWIESDELAEADSYALVQVTMKVPAEVPSVCHTVSSPLRCPIAK